MAPIRIFLTGEPGCGKTTVVRKTYDILVNKGMKPGGVISGEIRQRGVRIGFSLEDLITHEIGVLAHTELKDGPRVGKYRVNLSDVQRVGVTGIRRAIAEGEVIIVDELGPMELHCTPFVLTMQEALSSPKHFIGTIHKRASHELIASIKSNPDYRIFEVTIDNRNEMPNRIVEQLTGRMPNDS
jgi:nucleoside-triphosphatase